MNADNARILELLALDGIMLRAMAKKLGLKQKDIARELNVTDGAVSHGFNDDSAVVVRRRMRRKIVELLVKHEKASSGKGRVKLAVKHRVTK